MVENSCSIVLTFKEYMKTPFTFSDIHTDGQRKIRMFSILIVIYKSSTVINTQHSIILFIGKLNYQEL